MSGERCRLLYMSVSIIIIIIIIIIIAMIIIIIIIIIVIITTIIASELAILAVLLSAYTDLHEGRDVSSRDEFCPGTITFFVLHLCVHECFHLGIPG